MPQSTHWRENVVTGNLGSPTGKFIDNSAMGIYPNNAALREVVGIHGAQARTVDQVSVFDCAGGTWRYKNSGVAATFAHDGLTCLVASGSDGSRAWLKTDGRVWVNPPLEPDTHIGLRLALRGGIVTILEATGAPSDSVRVFVDSEGVGGEYALVLTDHAALGTRVDLSYGTEPVGQPGASGRITVHVKDQILYVQNRLGVNRSFIIEIRGRYFP